jgi:hypothetical protein
MNTRKIIIFIGILIALTLLAAVLHLTTREEVPEHAVKVTTSEKETLLDIMSLEYTTVTGVRVNGKGEEIPVEGEGISMKELLEEMGITKYTTVTVVSNDSYSAKMNREEILEEDKVFLLLEDNSLRLIVFGDSNSKRNVSNVVQIQVE